MSVEQRFSLVGLTLFQGLTDAEDDVEPASQGKPNLLVDECIGFSQLVPPLAVSEDDVPAPEIEQHRRADLAGECALFFGIHVLCSERNAAALENLPDKRQIGKGRTENDSDRV